MDGIRLMSMVCAVAAVDEFMTVLVLSVPFMNQLDCPRREGSVCQDA